MIKSLRHWLGWALVGSAARRELLATQLGQGRVLSELNAAKPVSNLNACEFKVFSQFGEDGIIQRLVRHVPIEHRTFIEFGVENFAESNCRFLMMNDNWRGFVMDGSPKRIGTIRQLPDIWKFDLAAKAAFVTRENVDELLAASGFDPDLGVLSIDVDGNDYWILEAITVVRPRLLIVEYNALFGAERNITVPYDARFAKYTAHRSGLYFGASLGALSSLAARKGYSLVATESSGINAFFVRTDLLGNGLVARTVAEAFHDTNVRQSRGADGRLDYLDRHGRAAAIRGLPVMNVDSGALEAL
ncbi:MAG: hypothetical protein ACHQQR_10445 [Gemmatimonadales bacterium]